MILLIVDCETTGTDPKIDKVIEVGAVRWSTEHGCVLSAWSEVVIQPSNPAEELNGIPSAALASGRDFDLVLASLQADADDSDVIVAHSLPFDRDMLGTDLDKPWVCSCRDIEWPRKGANRTLVEIAVAHGVPVVSAHRALTDCLLLAAVFESVWRAEYHRIDEPPCTFVNGMIRRAMRPKSRIEAVCSYTQMEDLRKSNQDPKSRGFAWDPQRKTWWRDLATDDVPGDPLAEWGFRVLVIGPVPS